MSGFLLEAVNIVFEAISDFRPLSRYGGSYYGLVSGITIGTVSSPSRGLGSFLPRKKLVRSYNLTKFPAPLEAWIVSYTHLGEKIERREL